MSDDWIVRRLAEVKKTLAASGNSIAEPVVQEFSSLLVNDQKKHLTPSELREAVARLAKANNPALK